MSGDARKRDDQSAISHPLPIEIIAPRGVGGQIPATDLHPIDLWQNCRQQRLLNRPGNPQIMLNLFQLTLHLGFAQRCLHTLSNLITYQARDKSARQKNRRVENNGRLSD